MKREQMLMNIVPYIMIGSKIRQKFKSQSINLPPFIHSKKNLSLYKKLFNHTNHNLFLNICFVQLFCFLPNVNTNPIEGNVSIK